MHKFDSLGRHLETEHKFTGTAAGEPAVIDAATLELENMIKALGPVKFGDIGIGLFEVEIDGSIFGMVDSSSAEWGDSATMEPADLMFYPPWDGEYDT